MKRFSNILFVAEDAAIEQDAAIDRAVSLAQNNQAFLTVLSVIEPPALGPFAASVQAAELEARMRQQALERMASLVAPYRERVHVQMKVRSGVPFIEVVRDVLAEDRDLVTKVAGYGGGRAFLLGGMDRHLLRKCPCPVWVMDRETTANYRRILAAVDVDPWGERREESGLNRRILEIASSLALSDFAELHVAHAWEPIADSLVRVFASDVSREQLEADVERERRAHLEQLEGLTSKLRSWAGEEAYRYLSPRLHLRKGNARAVIPDLAAELQADLVVMGTVSRAGIPGFIIGNTAEVILNNIDCSVLAVKPEGFVTPVSG